MPLLGASDREGCTVDIDLWLRLMTNHTPPGEEIEVLQPAGMTHA